MIRAAWYLLILTTVLAGPLVQSARAQDDQTTIERATWLLRKATLIHRRGFQNILLRALRQMEDPELEPLFSQLVQRPHSSMKIHGILGLAEISPRRELDLALVAELKSQAAQAELVSAAMDAKLLTTQDALQLINWPGLDRAVKVIVACRLVHEGQPFATQVLDEAVNDDNLALRGMAAMLRLQLDLPGALKQLEQVARDDAPNRDHVLTMLLESGMRYEFDRLGPWATWLLTGQQLDQQLEIRALRAAMMFQAPGAMNIWMQRFDAQENEAHRIRLAAMTLDIAERVEAPIFRQMAEDESKLIQQIAAAGRAIRDDQSATPAIETLIQQNNVLLSRWALHYASDQPAETARPILLALIKAADDGQEHFRAQRLELAVLASEQMAESGGAASHEALRRALADASPLLQEAILMGLIRTEGPVATQVLEGAVEPASRTGQAMALLLRAKQGEPLDKDQMQRLSLIVRGGAGLQEPLRLQAAWVYLKHTRRSQVALATVLGHGAGR